MNKNPWENQELISTLLNDKVAVMPTDTIYGMVCRALCPDAVNRVYEIRSRAGDKPCIILIGDVNELDRFSIAISEKQREELSKYWGDAGGRGVSVVLDCLDDKFVYLHRGTKTLAFRLPKIKELRDFLSKTGPLIAPSANIEKFPASESVEDARKYFGDKVDLYVDAGPIVSLASQVIRLHPDGSVTILRE